MDRFFFYVEGDTHVTETTLFSYDFDRKYDDVFSTHIFLGIIRVNQFIEVEDPRLPVYKSDEDFDFYDNSRDFDNRLKIKLSSDLDAIIEDFDNSEILVFHLRPRQPLQEDPEIMIED